MIDCMIGLIVLLLRMRGLAVGRLRVARVERLDVGVAGVGRVLHVVEHVVNAEA